MSIWDLLKLRPLRNKVDLLVDELRELVALVVPVVKKAHKVMDIILDEEDDDVQ